LGNLAIVDDEGKLEGVVNFDSIREILRKSYTKERAK
jgi:hypothetical protein